MEEQLAESAVWIEEKKKKTLNDFFLFCQKATPFQCSPFFIFPTISLVRSNEPFTRLNSFNVFFIFKYFLSFSFRLFNYW